MPEAPFFSPTKVLMLGWEYPPAFTGGLGVATKGLVEAMRHHADVQLMLPTSISSFDKSATAKASSNAAIVVEAPLQAYGTYTAPVQAMPISHEVQEKAIALRQKAGDVQEKIYGNDLLEQVKHFAEEAVQRAAETSFDVIHAHDWMTFPAALQIKEATQKPLVLHIHSLETDRAADTQARNPVYEIERQAIAQADKVLAVSEYTKETLIKQYGAEPEQVAVVYNGTPPIDPAFQTLFPQPMNTEPANETPSWMGDYQPEESLRKGRVLFLGRVTAQKGPLTFVRTAKKLLSDDVRVKFIVAGLGDQLEEMMQLAEDERIGRHVDFKGFVKRKKLRKLLKKTDILFMPSVSEPFGLVALEAAQMGIPVIASRQAGVAEVLPGVLVAEHWDSQTFARHIAMLLQYKDLRKGMGKANRQAVEKLTWDEAAKQIMLHYEALLHS